MARSNSRKACLGAMRSSVLTDIFVSSASQSSLIAVAFLIRSAALLKQEIGSSIWFNWLDKASAANLASPHIPILVWPDRHQKVIFNVNTQSLKISPEAPFNWKLLKFGIVSAKGIRKYLPVLQVGGSAPAPPTPPVFRVVLLHTEAAIQDFCPDTVSGEEQQKHLP